jgi:hypothetical protein
MRFGGSARRGDPTTGQASRQTGARAIWPASLAVALVLTAGCDRVGNPFEALGGSVPPPDEFQVMQYEPPVIPEAYSLPEPTPGAPSPRAPNPEQQAVAALYGPGAARAAAADPSAGEQRLLASADAASASEDIRVQLEQDRQARPDEPYEPPTLWELLGFGSDEEEIDETQIIDPDTEAARLQAQGVPTPVDPTAAERAAREAAEEAEEAAAPPPESLDRRPANRVGPPIEPAF